MFCMVATDNPMVLLTPSIDGRMSAISAASTATSVPVPIAMPTSACLNEHWGQYNVFLSLPFSFLLQFRQLKKAGQNDR